MHQLGSDRRLEHRAQPAARADVSQAQLAAARHERRGDWASAREGWPLTDGHSQPPPGPDEGDLTAVSATSASNVWTVGTYDPAYGSEIYDNYSVLEGVLGSARRSPPGRLSGTGC